MDYEVKALLKVSVNETTSVTKLLKIINNLDSKIKSTEKSSTSLASTMQSVFSGVSSGISEFLKALPGLAIIAGQFQRIVGYMKSMVASSFRYTSTLESMKISIASVTASIKGISFAAATSEANDIYERLVALSAVSPVGPKELTEIFQGLQAPMTSAGRSLDQILETAKNASAAMGALGVDVQQGARDVQLIAAGRAGAQVKLFSRLVQSMNIAGKEANAEYFNKLSSNERVKILSDALKKAGGEAAKAFGQSFEGLSSTFAGLKDEFMRMFITPVYNSVKGVLSKFNEFLIAYKKPLDDMLNVFGSLAAKVLEPVLDKGLEFAKMLIKGAIMFKNIGLGAGEKTLSARGAGIGVGMGDALAGAGKLAGTIGAGSAIGAGAGAASLGAIGALVGSIVPVIGTAVGGAVGTALGTVLGGLTGGGVGAGLLSIMEAIGTNAQTLYHLMRPLTHILAPSVYSAFLEVWRTAQPIFKTIGNVLVISLAPAFVLMVATLTVAAKVVEDFAIQMRGISEAIGGQEFANAEDAMKGFSESVVDFANILLAVYESFKVFTIASLQLGIGDYIGAYQTLSSVKPQEINIKDSFKNKGQRRTTNGEDVTGFAEKNDNRSRKTERGAKIEKVYITVQQKFTQANPDRIVRQMFNDIGNQAERVLSSPFDGVFGG